MLTGSKRQKQNIFSTKTLSAIVANRLKEQFIPRIRTKDVTPFPHPKPYNILIPGGNSASLRQSALHIVTMHGIWSLNVGLLDIRLLTAMLYNFPWASVTPETRKSQKITNASVRKTVERC